MGLAWLVVGLISAGFPEALSHPPPGTLESFQWPAPKRFDAAWLKASRDSRGHTLLELQIDGKYAGWYVVTAKPVRLTSLIGKRTDTLTPTSELGDSFSAARWDRVARQVKVLQRLEEHVTEPELVAWTYVSTLLESKGKLYADELGDDPSLEKLASDLGYRPLAELETWAAANKGDEALFESLRHYRPMGTCSVDTAPQRTARLFAELAFARGDLGRFLQLQVRIMGDQFERTAWSTYGERGHDTEAERLLRPGTGIDLDTFFIGLGVAVPSRAEGLGSWRLARAINEAGRGEALLPKFEAMAVDPQLDAYNRLRATQTWLFLQVKDEEALQKKGGDAAVKRARDVLRERARGLKLHPLALDWVND